MFLLGIGCSVISCELFINKNCFLVFVLMIVNCKDGGLGLIIGIFLVIKVIIFVLMGILFVGLLLLGISRIFFFERLVIFILMK